MSKTFPRRAALPMLSLLALLAATPAHAEAPEPIEVRKINLTYEVYLGGLPLGRARLQARIEGDRYTSRSKVTASALVGLFYDIEAESSSEGRLPAAGGDGDGDALTPTAFELTTRVEDEDFAMRMDFEDEAPADVEAFPAYKAKNYEIDPRDQKGALDPMSAVLAAFLPAASGDPCKRSVTVFDGRRRMDIELVRLERAYVKRGVRMVQCEGLFRRVAGFSPKMMRETEFPFRVRFMLDDENRPTATRLWGDTDFGVIIARLRGGPGRR